MLQQLLAGALPRSGSFACTAEVHPFQDRTGDHVPFESVFDSLSAIAAIGYQKCVRVDAKTWGRGNRPSAKSAIRGLLSTIT
jgi:hypothetical protein